MPKIVIHNHLARDAFPKMQPWQLVYKVAPDPDGKGYVVQNDAGYYLEEGGLVKVFKTKPEAEAAAKARNDKRKREEERKKPK
jgi:hypothetical protein